MPLFCGADDQQMGWGLACIVFSLKWDSKKIVFMSLPSCVISMTARHCCIYSAAGNQGPIPGLTAAQISSQVQLRWFALNPPSACVLFCPWVCCLPMWNSDLAGNNAPTSSRITRSLWIPLQNPNKQQQVGLTIVIHGHFLRSSDNTVTPISIS